MPFKQLKITNGSPILLLLKSILIGFISLFILAGCARTPLSHRDDPQLEKCPTNFVVNQVYILKKPVFLVRQPSGYAGDRPPFDFLYPESRYTDGEFDEVPPTIGRYETDGGSKWPRVSGILLAGTRIQYKEMKVTQSMDYGRQDSPLVLILDEQFHGVGLVNISYICKRGRSAIGTYINSTLLESE